MKKKNFFSGISVDSVDRGVNGMLVVLVVPGGAVARDGHIHPGDYLVSVNHETLRKVTNSQARAILRRAQLLSTDIRYFPFFSFLFFKKRYRVLKPHSQLTLLRNLKKFIQSN